MSRLIEKHKKLSLEKFHIRERECMRFTNVMSNIVDRQEEHNKFLEIWLRSYPTDCDAFKQYVSNINHNPTNNIHIEYAENDVNYISTKVDIVNNLVTYNLSYQHVHGCDH
jgi:hypothetical protein